MAGLGEGFRAQLAQRLAGVMSRRADNRRFMDSVPAYRYSELLSRFPSRLLSRTPEVSHSLQHGGEELNYGLYTSNEFYLGLSGTLRGLGGVGIAVGPDQPLDFLIMGNLRKMYAVDIDPNTHLITRLYVELGSRLHKLEDNINNYPKVNQYMSLFKPKNRELLFQLLEAPSSGYNFSQNEIGWLRDFFDRGDKQKDFDLYSYLRDKQRYYGPASWIGTDENLENVVRAYEEGRITIVKGSISGRIIPKIAAETKAEREHVSLIYLSNALVHSAETLRVFKQLPLTNRSKVIYSADPPNAVRIEPPKEYRFAKNWSMHVFSPLDFSDFPEAYDYRHLEIPTGQYERRTVAKGVYILEPLAA